MGTVVNGLKQGVRVKPEWNSMSRYYPPFLTWHILLFSSDMPAKELVCVRGGSLEIRWPIGRLVKYIFAIFYSPTGHSFAIACIMCSVCYGLVRDRIGKLISLKYYYTCIAPSFCFCLFCICYVFYLFIFVVDFIACCSGRSGGQLRNLLNK